MRGWNFLSAMYRKKVRASFGTFHPMFDDAHLPAPRLWPEREALRARHLEPQLDSITLRADSDKRHSVSTEPSTKSPAIRRGAFSFLPRPDFAFLSICACKLLAGVTRMPYSLLRHRRLPAGSGDMPAGCWQYKKPGANSLSPKLAKRPPANRNVQPKIRQQLQVLRDMGFVEFLGAGRYRLL